MNNLNLKKSFLFLLLAAFTMPGYSQVNEELQEEEDKEPRRSNVLDGVYVKEHFPKRKYTKYAPLREADVMWSRRVWRYLDLDEKINHVLMYPKSSRRILDRSNLFDIIHDAAKTPVTKVTEEQGHLDVYQAYDGIFDDDEFTLLLTDEEVMMAGGSPPDTIGYEDPDTGEWIEQIIKNELDPDEVKKFQIKEDWVFDKQRSIIEPRIIGIAPCKQQFTESGEFLNYLKLYWVYFPELRNILKNKEVFNRANQAERRTFDDIFMKRMFSSYVIKESNTYNRKIQDYASGIDALLESERIKNEMFLLEHDLWEY